MRTRLDFSVAAIVNISPQSLQSLETVQRTCLLSATKCTAQTSTEVLNILTNILPIDLHLKKRAAEYLCRLSSKNNVSSSFYHEWQERSANLNRPVCNPITSFSKMEMAYKQITRMKFVSPLPVTMYSIEQPAFIDQKMLLTYSRNATEQVQNVENIIQSNDYDVIISTDGSSSPSELSHFGLSGAGAVVKLRSTDVNLELRKPICTMTNNYEAELHGIDIAMNYLLEDGTEGSNIIFLSDCTSALDAAFSNSNIREYNNIIHSIRTKRDIVKQRNTNVVATWVPGHNGVQLNEDADRIAKAAASEADNRKIPERTVSLKIVKESAVNKSWSFRYKSTLCDHFIYNITKQPGKWISIPHNRSYHIINQLVSGHNYLNASRSRITGESPDCDCGEPETKQHYLCHCERFTRQRSELLHNINLTLKTNFVSVDEINPSVLFGQCSYLNKGQNIENMNHLLDYINSTGRFK